MSIYDDKGLATFPSMAAMASLALEIQEGKHGASAQSKLARFFGRTGFTGEPGDGIIPRMMNGDDSRVAEAEAIISRIESLNVTADALHWTRDVEGGFPDVPAFLSGDPECMVTRRRTLSEKAPVRVFYCISASGSFEPADLAKRGVSAVALVMALIRRGRPVELFTYTAHDGDRGGRCVNVVRQATNPLDLSSIAYALTSGGFYRGADMGISAGLNGFTGAWSPELKSGGMENQAQADRSGRATLEAAGVDLAGALVVGPLTHGAKSEPMFTDPPAWINATIRKLENDDPA